MIAEKKPLKHEISRHILRKSVVFKVLLFNGRKMNGTISIRQETLNISKLTNMIRFKEEEKIFVHETVLMISYYLDLEKFSRLK